jgi:hypothetical protein
MPATQISPPLEPWSRKYTRNQHTTQSISAMMSRGVPERDPRRQQWDPNNHPQRIDRSNLGYTKRDTHPAQTNNVS